MRLSDYALHRYLMRKNDLQLNDSWVYLVEAFSCVSKNAWHAITLNQLRAQTLSHVCSSAWKSPNSHAAGPSTIKYACAH